VEKGPTPDAGCCPTLNSGQIVLIVEDNDEVRRISASMMDDLGYTTITTRNGIEAMAVLSTGEPIDILFSDVFMPRGMSGVQLAEQALALRPTLKVLLTTASLDADARFPLLRKPYTKSELGKKMSDLSAIPQGEVGRPRRRL
jgi:CheY-like chemotaxis protein